MNSNFQEREVIVPENAGVGVVALMERKFNCPSSLGPYRLHST